jgi:hypothetical protein
LSGEQKAQSCDNACFHQLTSISSINVDSLVNGVGVQYGMRPSCSQRMSLTFRGILVGACILLKGCNHNSPPPLQTFHQLPSPSSEILVPTGAYEPFSVIEDFSVTHTINGLPGDCRKAFTLLTRESQFSMADPGQQFQWGDVVQEYGLPVRRLLFGGFNDQKCFIFYEKGGRGHSYNLLVFKMGGFHPATWAGFAYDGTSDLSGLRAMLVAHKFFIGAPAAW